MLPPRDPSQIESYTQTISKGVEKCISCKWKEKKVRPVILIANKIDFKTKTIVRDKEGHYIILKVTIQQEDITLVNIYAHNIGAPKYVKQILMDIMGEIDKNTVIIGDFNTLLTTMNRSFRQKINQETVALKDTLDQMYLIDIFRAFHPKAAEHIYCSSAHGMFSSRIDHMLGHKETSQ